MTPRLAALGIERAADDGDRAVFLQAIITFAELVGDADLAAEAQSLMPKAHPFEPNEAWAREYSDGFFFEAEEESGVYFEEMPRYRLEFWQMKTDAWRQERLQDPTLGRLDGKTDAANLNAA